MKKAVVPALHRLALLTCASAVKAKALKVGRIISFHGVGDEFYPAANFEKHLRYLGRHFSIVSLATLLERMNSPQGLTNEITLTFDDGLRNNFTMAYPLLKKFNAPATFFVCPGLIENGRWLWTHEMRAQLAWLSEIHVEPILAEMKALGLKERTAAEDNLRRRTAGFKPTEKQCRNFDLMSWDELRALDSTLIAIGSHSLTHPILSTLTGTELTVEITESRRMLEKKLVRAVEFFCYPNGAHNPEVVQLVAENYRAAVTTEAGFVESGNNRHQLPRIGITPKLAYFAWRLHRPRA